MAKQPQLILLGDKRLQLIFDSLAPKEAKKAVRKAARAVGKKVLTAAKAEVPRDQGLLAASLSLKSLTTKTLSYAMRRARIRKYIEGVSIGTFKGSDPSYEQAANARKLYWGGPVEYGRKPPIQDQGHPFLRPALFGSEAAARALYAAELKNAINALVRVPGNPKGGMVR
jgi:hypothetical protein